MIKKVRTVGGGAALLSVLALHAPADAAQVNVAATMFHKQIAGADVIFFSGNSAANFSASFITMIAPVPRVPGGGAVTVFVDGFHIGSGNYVCSVMSSVATKSFTRTPPMPPTPPTPGGWTNSVNFTAAEMPSSSFLTVSCSVPPDGVLKGITVTG